MDNRRPEGRKTTHVGGTGSVNKRGQGLGTGPVGTGTGRKNSQSFSSNGAYNTGIGSERTTRAGSGRLGFVVVLIVLLLLGGKTGLSGLLTGGDSSYDTQSGVSTSQQGADLLGSFASSILGGSQTSNYVTQSVGSQSQSQSAVLNTEVDPSARSKFYTPVGNGDDTITIMVFMCGTDLESRSGMATADMVEMTKAELSDKINLIIYTGGCKKWQNNVVSNSVNQIYRVKDGGLTCLESDMGNKAMTDPNTLVEFVNYCNKNFPADRKELIFWDHGGGSLTGYGYDEKNGNGTSMTLAGINQAMKSVGTKFDFIGFDACLMATMENALMLTDYADYLIASEETEPGVGWYYTNWLTKLSQNTSMPTVEIGKNIIDDFVDVCNSKCPGQKTTLSIVDLSELQNTVPSELTDFAKATNELIRNKEYSKVSKARNKTREFAQSSAIDQVDLVNLVNNMGTESGEELSKVILNAVKYNRTSSSITNANGISIYFPYKKASKVKQAVSTYNAIGMDSEYSKCIAEFASLEACGQASSQGATTPVSSLFGSVGSGQSSNTDMISGLLSGFLGSGMSGGIDLGDILSMREMSAESTEEYIKDNYFDGTLLTWKDKDGEKVIELPEKMWDLVNDVELNVFVDDGEGYIDLGLDNILDYNEDGDLLYSFDNSWLSWDSQVVPFYHMETVDGVTTGYIPAFLNGDRVQIIVVFDDEHPSGYVAGASYDYRNNETEAISKNMLPVNPGDKIDFVCDYYTYDGEYDDSYYLGETLTVGDEIVLGNIDLGDAETSVAYRFTDIYDQHYWTESCK
ncbi:MAG: peptidase C11 [Lachnospiraceae bacterium]|nr:peptidase C11 [Lachnospiraceae bacterium]